MGEDRMLIELAVSSPKAAVIISPACVLGLQVLLLYLLNSLIIYLLLKDGRWGFNNHVASIIGLWGKRGGIRWHQYATNNQHHNREVRATHTQH